MPIEASSRTMDEHDPVSEQESIYRRIAPLYFDANLSVGIQLQAFRPTSNDTNGLSVLRSAFARPEDTLASLDPDKSKGYYVARLYVRDLHSLGLTVVPDPLPSGPPGHALIPELNVAAYRAHKVRWKQILIELARLASADIVLRPL
jgi:hypothetical protein